MLLNDERELLHQHECLDEINSDILVRDTEDECDSWSFFIHIDVC